MTRAGWPWSPGLEPKHASLAAGPQSRESCPGTVIWSWVLTPALRSDVTSVKSTAGWFCFSRREAAQVAWSFHFVIHLFVGQWSWAFWVIMTHKFVTGMFWKNRRQLINLFRGCNIFSPRYANVAYWSVYT